MKQVKQKRVLIDARMVREQPNGIGSYVAGLARGFAELAQGGGLKVQPVFLVCDSDQECFKNFETIHSSVKFLSPLEWIKIPQIIRKNNIDLFHSTSFCSFPYCPVPYVQTVHDLNHLTYGSLDKKIYYSTLLKRFALGSSKLLTVSRSVAHELSGWLGVPVENVKVVPNSFWIDQDGECANSFLEKWNIKSKRYFLLISNPKVHKNNPFLIRAFLKTTPHFQLVINLNPDEVPKELADNPRIKFVGPLERSVFNDVIRQASAILSPSLYEGFGRVPLEALYLGTPVIASDIAVHRELLQGWITKGVTLLDPKSESVWSDSLELWQSHSEPRSVVQLSQEIESIYAPSRIAQMQLNIYQDVLDLECTN